MMLNYVYELTGAVIN